MNVAEAVILLKKKGVIKTESTIKYLAGKYDLYNPSTGSARRGLDPIKIKDLAGVLGSPLRIAEIARQASVPYSKVNYYLLKNRIPVIKRYGVCMLKNKKDLENVKKNL